MRIAIATAALGLAFLLCEILWPLLEPGFAAPLLVATGIITWLCGVRYGVIASAIALIVSDYFFVPPYNSFFVWNWNSGLRLVVFGAAAALLIMLLGYIARLENELAASEQRHRSITELIPFGGWTSDAQGNMLRLSESFLNAFETKMDECKGLGWLRLIDEDQRPQVLADWRECMRHGYFWDYEYRMTSPAGTRYVVLSRGMPVRHRHGQVISWVGIHLDITELERSAEQRVQQARDLARFNAELEQLAYVSAHDLQEPLRMIASYLQLLSRRYRGRLDQEADTFIEYAVDGANRLRNLLQDLMVLQQIGKNTRPRSWLPLNHYIERARQNLSESVAAAEAVITADTLPAVRADEAEFIQLFENLLENAIKYRRDGVAPRVHISVERMGMEWKIAVKDNGIGIDPEYREKIFHIFQRLHGRAQYQGTGIGLPICKKIVEVHGGRIWVESEPGRGSTFYFTVPSDLSYSAIPAGSDEPTRRAVLPTRAADIESSRQGKT